MKHVELITSSGNTIKINPDDVRHIEETINSYGEDVHIVHLYSKGTEYTISNTDTNNSKIKHIIQSSYK